MMGSGGDHGRQRKSVGGCARWLWESTEDRAKISDGLREAGVARGMRRRAVEGCGDAGESRRRLREAIGRLSAENGRRWGSPKAVRGDGMMRRVVGGMREAGVR